MNSISEQIDAASTVTDRYLFSGGVADGEDMNLPLMSERKPGIRMENR
jgi:hypothetical protein